MTTISGNTITGTSSNDKIYADDLVGDDISSITINGGDGDDHLGDFIVKSRVTSINGGNGNDWMVASSYSKATFAYFIISGGDGNDWLILPGNSIGTPIFTREPTGTEVQYNDINGGKLSAYVSDSTEIISWSGKDGKSVYYLTEDLSKGRQRAVEWDELYFRTYERPDWFYLNRPDTYFEYLNSITPPANTPTYTLTPSVTLINEGSTLITSVATTNVASGTALYYSLSGTGINTADFTSGSLTGSGTVSSSGSFSFSHTLANDLKTEGTETLNIKLFSDSNRLVKVGETNVSIIDYVGGSTDYSYSLSRLSGSTSPNSLIGAFENYQFYNLGGNRQGIQKKGTGAIDEITGISSLTFNDTKVSVSDNIIGVFNQVTGKETKDAQMFRLYNASFNRFPDSDGLKYWINEYSKGITDYRNIAESFIISSEFKQRYGASNTNLEFATNMYKNILGRLPDSEGLNYWVSNLNAGTNSRVDVLGGFSESVENKNLFSQVTGFI